MVVVNDLVILDDGCPKGERMVLAYNDQAAAPPWSYILGTGSERHNRRLRNFYSELL